MYIIFLLQHYFSQRQGCIIKTYQDDLWNCLAGNIMPWGGGGGLYMVVPPSFRQGLASNIVDRPCS